MRRAELPEWCCWPVFLDRCSSPTGWTLAEFHLLAFSHVLEWHAIIQLSKCYYLSRLVPFLSLKFFLTILVHIHNYSRKRSHILYMIITDYNILFSMWPFLLLVNKLLEGRLTLSYTLSLILYWFIHGFSALQQRCPTLIVFVLLTTHFFLN